MYIQQVRLLGSGAAAVRCLEKLPLLLGLALFLISPIAVADDGNEITAMFAARALDEMLAAQTQIVTLQGAEKDLAILLAGGALNEKLTLIFGTWVKEGKLTLRESYQAAFIALTRLSNLAGEAGYPEAAICHLQESLAMKAAASGSDPNSVHCRNQAYGHDVQSNAMRVAHGQRGEELNLLANRWATNAALVGERGARLERRAN